MSITFIFSQSGIIWLFVDFKKNNFDNLMVKNKQINFLYSFENRTALMNKKKSTLTKNIQKRQLYN